jgi:hypothetical protein
MEHILPNYSRPIASTKEPSIETKYWDKAKDDFDDKLYKKAVIGVINYLNTEVLKEVDTQTDVVKFTQMHGSVEINMEIDPTTFKIYIPFLKITEETNVVALLRKVAEVNFRRFDLAQIALDKDELFVRCEVPLELCKPYKIYMLLREVCFRTDELDDEFIDKYEASFIKKPNCVELSDEDKVKAWKQIDNILDDYDKYSAHFKEKQWDGYLWDIGVICLLKLANMPYLNGVLRHELMDTIDLMYNSDKQFTYRVEKGKNFIKKLSMKSKAEIMSNVYHSEQFISLLWRSSDEIIEKKMEDYKESIEKYDRDENFFATSYYLQTVFLKLIYNYNLEDNYRNAIQNVLEEISGKTDEASAPKLLKLYNAFSKRTLTPKVEEKKSFWSKLFGGKKRND